MNILRIPIFVYDINDNENVYVKSRIWSQQTVKKHTLERFCITFSYSVFGKLNHQFRSPTGSDSDPNHQHRPSRIPGSFCWEQTRDINRLPSIYSGSTILTSFSRLIINQTFGTIAVLNACWFSLKSALKCP